MVPIAEYIGQRQTVLKRQFLGSEDEARTLKKEDIEALQKACGRIAVDSAA